MTLEIKSDLEQHFLDNWIDTDSIQFEGVPFNYEHKDKWISLVYTPVENTIGGLAGNTCRIHYNAMLKVFCYAKSVPLAFKLADEVKAFFNGVGINGIIIGIGQDRGATNLENGYFEVTTIFEVNKN